MAKDKYYGKTLRKNFARHEEVMPMPNLLEIQKKSYQEFLDTGLREVFNDVGAITDYQGNLELTFIDYKMDEAPKYDVEECKARDATYAAPLKVKVRLRNKETEEIKEQEIFMGDFPLMTHSGTFVINGAERVVVSQIVRSPGVYYGKETDIKTDLPILTSTVIPNRGAWLEYETDANEVFWVRIDKNRKLPITCLIRALGLKTDGEILDRFGDDPRIVTTMEKDTCKSYEEAMLEIYRKQRPGEPPTLDSAENLMQGLFFDPRRYDLSTVGRYKFNKKLTLWTQAKGQKLAEPVADPATGELRSVVEREEMLRELLGILKDVKAALTAPEADLAALLEEQLRRQKTRIDTGRRSGSLSQEAERSHRRIIAALERQKALAGQTVDSQTGFAAVKADFDQMVQGLKAQAKTAGEMLNNLFAFCEEVFPEGQELLILVTELTINYYAATFISRYGCDAYFTHNQELLFYERQQEIISQLESLELN